MATQETTNDFPRKAIVKILGYLSQNQRQGKRLVNQQWNKTIAEDFPVELIISNSNYERMFKCSNAKMVTIHSLTVESTGNMGFRNSVKTIVISGKVVSAIITKILSSCQELETLVISSPKEVLGINENLAFVIPKLSTIEFKVRMDQETFTSDEIILLNAIRHAKLTNLEKVLITVNLDSDWTGETYNESEELVVTGTPISEYSVLDDMTDDGVGSSQIVQAYPVGVRTSSEGDFTEEPLDYLPSEPSAIPTGNTIVDDLEAALDVAPEDDEVITLGEDQEDLYTTGTTTEPTPAGEERERPVQVDVSVGMTATEANSRASRTTTRSITDNNADYDYANRLFMARLQMRQRNSFSDLDTFLNDPVSMSRGRYFGLASLVNQMNSPVPTQVDMRVTAFFELLTNNASKLKVFVVKVRPDFLCFGNIASFPKESYGKIQCEDMEYSFGRSKRLCAEHYILENQNKLRTLKLHILDDMWNSVMIAAERCQSTLAELDVKILCLNEAPIDLLALSYCKSLRSLKLFHFFEKKNINILPTSLQKLVLNGPLSKQDLESFATRLVNLVQFDLILNYNPADKIDLPLFKKLVALPKIRKLVFIQTQIDVDAVEEFCRGSPTILLGIQGPRKLHEPYTLTSSIQYVAVTVDHDSSQREQEIN